MNNLWNGLNGDNAIDLFESKWCEWNIDETIKWFDFVIKWNNYNDNKKIDDQKNTNDHDSDYEIEFYSDDDDDDSLSGDSKNDCNSSYADYKFVKSRLTMFQFNAKKDLPFMMQLHHFKRFGFNTKESKLLCKCTKQLIQKYPKKRKKTQRRNIMATTTIMDKKTTIQIERFCT